MPHDAATLHHYPALARRAKGEPSQLVAVHKACNELAGDLDIELYPLVLDIRPHAPPRRIYVAPGKFVLIQPETL